MTAAALALLAIAAICALAYAEDQRNMACRERIRREEADAWCEQSEQQAAALAAECGRLREQIAALRVLNTERTRDLLAQNYLIIAANVAGKRRRQQ